MKRSPDPQLVVQAAPFLRPQVSTPRIMGDVLIALAPATAAGIWFFGLSALLVVLAATAACVATDWLLGGRAQLADLSAVVTGVLVGLILPPSLPLWMAALGGFVAIALGKAAWGGLGHNLFNPALVGRAFLQAAFPIALTTWVPPQGPLALYRGNLALPFMQVPADAVSAVTSATPLGQMKFLGLGTPFADLFWGNVSGSIGETSAAAILLGALYLVARRACDWRLPAGMLGAAALLAELFHQLEPAKYPGALFTLLSGGLLLGAVFMASDPVTSPLAPRGAWIFAAGAGVLVVLIRFWGGLPEGVMYAILLMNSASPLIDRALQPRRFGGSAPKVSR